MPKSCWCVARQRGSDSPSVAHCNRTAPEEDRQGQVSISATSPVAAECDWLSDRKGRHSASHPLPLTQPVHTHTHMHKRGTATVTCSRPVMFTPATIVSWSKNQLLQGKKSQFLPSSQHLPYTLIHSHRCALGQKDTRWWCWSSQWHRGSGSESGGSARREWWPSPQTRTVRWLKLPPWEPQPDPRQKVTTSAGGTEGKIKKKKKHQESQTRCLMRWSCNSKKIKGQ